MNDSQSRPHLELVAGGKADDPRAALRELYSAYGGSVFGRCQYLLRDRVKAEDAMQDVFAKALLHWGEFRSESSPLTWLLRIATDVTHPHRAAPLPQCAARRARAVAPALRAPGARAHRGPRRPAAPRGSR